MGRRILSLWFTHLASDRLTRIRGVGSDACPCVVVGMVRGSARLRCVNGAARTAGLRRGIALVDARAMVPGLVTVAEQPDRDTAFLRALGRWCERYTPWIAVDGTDGLFLDVTGCTHIHGGEEGLLHDLLGRMEAQGMQVRAGIADTKGAAWALARYGQDAPIASPGDMQAQLGPLPVSALRLAPDTAQTLKRLGLRRVADLSALPRAAVARRFGPEMVRRLETAFGTVPDPVSPARFAAPYAVRLSLPDPIGRTDDVSAALDRLLSRLCARLERDRRGVRTLRFTIQRVDKGSETVEVSLSRPSHSPDRIAPLFERHIGALDAGFGIDALRLQATVTETVVPEQQDTHGGNTATDDRMHDVIARIGNRIGFDRIVTALPAESHIPERSFSIVPAANAAAGVFPRQGRIRPLVIFEPEPVVACDPAAPPGTFRWRRVTFRTAHVSGPERIAPEWWTDDPAWRSGPRDYWWVQTEQGRRLWLFRVHLSKGATWFAHGEFA